jgi:ankyrin repeat protein
MHNPSSNPRCDQRVGRGYKVLVACYHENMGTSAKPSWREALSRGSVEDVAYWLTRGQDPNALVEEVKQHPLVMAASANIPGRITQLLIDAGAQVQQCALHPLIVCSHTGNAQAARVLLEQGIQANHVAEDGQWVLDIAVESNHLEMTDILLLHGAVVDRPDKQGTTVLMKAAADTRLDMVKLLLAHGANPNCQDKRNAFALSIACTGSGDADEQAIVMALLEGTRRDLCNDLGCNVLQLCVGAEFPQAVRKLLDEGESVHHVNKRKTSILHMAAGRENVEILNMVLTAGGDITAVNINGDTPLIVAAKLGIATHVDILVNARSNINARNISSQTPLLIAAAQGLEDLFHALLKSGARLTDVNDEGGVLHHAAIGGNEDIVRWITQKGISDNQPSSDGKMALHLAAENNCPEAAIALLEAGSDLHKLTKEGADVFQLGCEDFNLHVRAYLAERQSRILHTRTDGAGGTSNRRRI